MPFKIPTAKQVDSTDVGELVPGLPIFNNEDYSLIDVIEKGGFGMICLVEKDNKRYIIKSMKKDMHTSYDVKLFEKDAKLLFQLRNHPNIVTIEGYSKVNSSLLIEYNCFDFKPLKLEYSEATNLTAF
jgi:serine/threonine protein kinase